MARVIRNGFISLDGDNHSSYCESWEPSWELEIQESRPFAVSAVAKDPGLNNNSFTATFIDDATMTMTQWLYSHAGTKVDFVLRYDAASVGVGNPQFEGSCIVPPMAPPATQGEVVRFSVTFQVDGAVTLETSA